MTMKWTMIWKDCAMMILMTATKLDNLSKTKKVIRMEMLLIRPHKNRRVKFNNKKTVPLE